MGLKTFNLAFNKEEEGERKLFRGYVDLIRPFLKGISTRQADVFAELIYWNYKKQSIQNKKDRFKLIMDSDTREAIEEYLGISTAVFRNALTGLRTKKLLDKDNMIPDVYLTPLTKDTLSITFNFQIKK